MLALKRHVPWLDISGRVYNALENEPVSLALTEDFRSGRCGVLTNIMFVYCFMVQRAAFSRCASVHAAYLQYCCC